ncbi:MAG: hypothetical protein U0736_27920 [Gemmataceae bacterium]
MSGRLIGSASTTRLIRQLLVVRLAEAGWWGQIIGPHGSGKSTLLATLLPELRRHRPVVTVELHTDRRTFPTLTPTVPPPLLVVDGYEQLGWWTRRRIQARCRQWGWGLMVTAHRDLGLPTLFRTAVTPALARAIVDTLVPPADHASFAQVDLSAGLVRHRGNLREVLFDLYDLYEQGSHAAHSE